MKETVGGSLCKFYHVHSGRLCILWWLSIAKKCVWVNFSIEAYAIFRQLHQQIYTLESYIVDALVADLFVTLLFLAVGALPFWYRSADRMGLFVSLVLITVGSFGIDEVHIQAFQNPPQAVEIKGVKIAGSCPQVRRTSHWYAR